MPAAVLLSPKTLGQAMRDIEWFGGRADVITVRIDQLPSVLEGDISAIVDKCHALKPRKTVIISCKPAEQVYQDRLAEMREYHPTIGFRKGKAERMSREISPRHGFRGSAEQFATILNRAIINCGADGVEIRFSTEVHPKPLKISLAGVTDIIENAQFKGAKVILSLEWKTLPGVKELVNRYRQLAPLKPYAVKMTGGILGLEQNDQLIRLMETHKNSAVPIIAFGTDPMGEKSRKYAYGRTLRGKFAPFAYLPVPARSLEERLEQNFARTLRKRRPAERKLLPPREGGKATNPRAIPRRRPK